MRVCLTSFISAMLAGSAVPKCANTNRSPESLRARIFPRTNWGVKAGDQSTVVVIPVVIRSRVLSRTPAYVLVSVGVMVGLARGNVQVSSQPNEILISATATDERLPE